MELMELECLVPTTFLLEQEEQVDHYQHKHQVLEDLLSLIHHIWVVQMDRVQKIQDPDVEVNSVLQWKVIFDTLNIKAL